MPTEMLIPMDEYSILWIGTPIFWEDYQETALWKAEKYGYSIQLISKRTGIPLYNGSDVFMVEFDKIFCLTPVKLLEEYNAD